MPDLPDQLSAALRGRICVVGVGNPDYGDDALGVRLAENLRPSDKHEVIVAGKAPERYVDRVTDGGFDTCLYLDAVDFGADPGAAVFLDAAGIAEKCPQISTHKLSLGLLAQLIEGNRRTRAWLLGVQPESLKFGAAMTPRVGASVKALRLLLQELLGATSQPAENDRDNEAQAGTALPPSPRDESSTREVTPC